ncbi:MAG: GtrA family protein [Phenylobacterium sp.]|uniref:GtrA family protein n=1 Tax=Phenylobacterium sp. TaxID=1871053 RepID=UPI00391CFD20
MRVLVGRIAALYFTPEFVRFLFAGGLAAAANFLSRFALQPGLGFLGAVFAAYLVGFAVAFVLNRAFVFPNSNRSLRSQIAWFLVFNLAALPVVVGASILLHRYVFGPLMPEALAEALAHGVSILLPVLVNFVAHKLVTFARHEA